MIICKLCHEEAKCSSTDPLMCKKCYSGITLYKRLVVKDRGALPPGNIKHLERMEKMFERNKAELGYVPRFYLAKKVHAECHTCAKSFIRVAGGNYCEPCKKNERAFRSLYRLDPNSITLQKYYDYYKLKYEQGRKVPKLYLDIKKPLNR